MMMKKISISIALLFSFFSSFLPIYAEGESTTVVVTEAIPWMNCTLDTTKWTTVDKRRYKCTVESWFSSITNMFAWFIKYATFLSVLIAVLLLVISWINMSISWWDEAKKAKDMFSRVLKALILLFLTWLILSTIAPWVYR